jgi:hypothetical protein
LVELPIALGYHLVTAVCALIPGRRSASMANVVIRTMDQKRRRFVCDGMLWEAWPSDLPPDPRVSEARAALPPSPPRLFFKSSTGMFRAVPYATASWAGLARMSDDDLRDIVRGLDYFG